MTRFLIISFIARNENYHLIQIKYVEYIVTSFNQISTYQKTQITYIVMKDNSKAMTATKSTIPKRLKFLNS